MHRVSPGLLVGIGILVLTILIGGFILLWVSRAQSNIPLATLQQSRVAPQVPAASEMPVVAATTTYVNETYGFSFAYPNTWEERRPYRTPEKPNEMLDKDLVFATSFVDPLGDRKQLLFDCVNERGVQWTNGSPTEPECAQVLAAYDAGSYPEPLSPHPFNIFVRVFKTEQPLEEWLISTYRKYGTELQDYQIGEAIELGGKQGFRSSTGCCMGIDEAYVVRHGKYIYEFGTNAAEGVQFIERMKAGFRFDDIQESPSDSSNVSEGP